MFLRSVNLWLRVSLKMLVYSPFDVTATKTTMVVVVVWGFPRFSSCCFQFTLLQWIYRRSSTKNEFFINQLAFFSSSWNSRCWFTFTSICVVADAFSVAYISNCIWHRINSNERIGFLSTFLSQSRIDIIIWWFCVDGEKNSSCFHCEDFNDMNSSAFLFRSDYNDVNFFKSFVFYYCQETSRSTPLSMPSRQKWTHRLLYYILLDFWSNDWISFSLLSFAR